MTARGAILGGVPLFQALDEAGRDALAGGLDAVTFQPGQTIFRVGDPGDSMFIVTGGEAEIFFADNTGHEIVLERPAAGAHFGELSLLDRGARNASARAISDVAALKVSHADLERLVKTHPQAGLDLLAAMARQVRVSAELLRHTASRNANEEIADNRSQIDRAADWIADFSGSITFLMIHIAFFTAWIGWNVTAAETKRFDPFPFGFLTLVVSLEAIILSVFVLLSQNRQVEKDKVRSDVEYDVNLKAELEIMQLHEKLDRLTGDTLTRLAAIEAKLPACLAAGS